MFTQFLEFVGIFLEFLGIFGHQLWNFTERGIHIFFKVASRIRDATFKMIIDPPCPQGFITNFKKIHNYGLDVG